MTGQERTFLKNLLIDIQNYICGCKDCNKEYTPDFCSIFGRLLIFLPRFNVTYNIPPIFYDNLDCLETNGLLQLTNDSLKTKGKVKCKDYKALLSYYYYMFYKIMVQANPENEELFNLNVLKKCVDKCIMKCIDNEFDINNPNGNVILFATINSQFVYTLVPPIEVDAINGVLDYEFSLVPTNTIGSIGFKFPKNYNLQFLNIFSNNEFVTEDISKWNVTEQLEGTTIYKIYTYIAKNTLDEYIPITSPQLYKLQIKRIT
jgi:hypothetical protein